jgi:predicted RNA-binding protein associated with RNAse of E/G family
MIAGKGKDTDGVAYIDDLYLDLVVYPDGTVLEDDMDELEEALRCGDISKELFDLAIDTCDKLKTGLLRDIEKFQKFTETILEMI